MECQWLEHLDAAVIERRINAADLVLGCSNFIAAGMLVFPSVWQEPSGFPTFEAQACGLPVVSTFSGGIPEYVEDGRTGILVARGEARELALAIAQVRDNRELARAMGEAGRRRAIEHFSLDVMSRRLVDLIQSLSPADGGQNDILNGPNSANARRDAPGRPPIPYLRPRQNSLSVARFQARQLLKFFVPLISYRINGDNYGR